MQAVPFTHFLAGMDDGKRTTETHLVPAHGTTTLTVVYTNDEATVETTLARFEQLLEKEKHKFVGLDLEYTHANKRKNPPQEIAVVQIAIHEEVLVYHFCRYVKFKFEITTSASLVPLHP